MNKPTKKATINTPLKHYYVTHKRTILFLLIIIVIAIVGFAYNAWLTYHDRPLARGFTFVGRDYDPGCPWVVYCPRSANELYYYTTNIAPDKLSSVFTQYVQTNSPSESHAEESGYTDYILKNQHTGNELPIIYMSNKEYETKRYNLRTTSDLYLVAVNKTPYDRYIDSQKP